MYQLQTMSNIHPFKKEWYPNVKSNLYMKHSVLKHVFVSKQCYIHWSQLNVVLYYNFSLLWHHKYFHWNPGPVGTTEVCSGDLWFSCSTSSLHGPPPPMLQSSLPSRAQLLRPGTPTQPASSLYLSKKHSRLYHAKSGCENSTGYEDSVLSNAV